MIKACDAKHLPAAFGRKGFELASLASLPAKKLRRRSMHFALTATQQQQVSAGSYMEF